MFVWVNLRESTSRGCETFQNVEILSYSGEHLFVLLKGVDFHILTGAPSPGRPFTPSRTELLIARANSAVDNMPFVLISKKTTVL